MLTCVGENETSIKDHMVIVRGNTLETVKNCGT